MITEVKTMQQTEIRCSSCHFIPPSCITIECTVASEFRRNKSPFLIKTLFSGSFPGLQFLRRGFWSGQFSAIQCKIQLLKTKSHRISQGSIRMNMGKAESVTHKGFPPPSVATVLQPLMLLLIFEQPKRYLRDG